MSIIGERDERKVRQHKSGASTKKTSHNLHYPILNDEEDIHQSVDDLDQSEDNQLLADGSNDYRKLNEQLLPFKEDHTIQSKSQDLPFTKRMPQLKKDKIQNKSKQSSDSFCSTKGLLLFISSLIALCISYLVFDGNRYFGLSANLVPFNRLTQSEWTLFESQFNQIESKFEKVLPNYGFKVMKTAVKRVMNKTSSSSRPVPAVILLIGSKEQTQVMKCIQNDFVNAINRAYNENNSIKINGKQTNTNDIIEKFEQTFGSEQKHTIIVENIESISTDHIMALHQFTDHENAKFPDSIIILTAIHYQKINLNKSAGLKDMDEIASQLFEMKWKNTMAEDQRSALISRFTPSVVTILEDKNNEIKC